MKRAFQYILAGLAMFTVALLTAFFSMRLAIHGREVEVPNLAGKSDSDAAMAAKKLGLNLSVENRFYSAAVAANAVLSQSPAAGSHVRRGWQVRVTESLGGQRVSVPDVTGQSERPASLVLRRLQLDVGTVARLPAPGPSGIVLAQSPPPNSVGLNGPQVTLLLSDGEVPPSTIAYVMPSIVGMTLGAANAKLASAGLRVGSAQQPQPSAPAAGTDTAAAGAAPNPAAGSSGASSSAEAGAPAPAPGVPPPPVSASAVIMTQSPAPGRKVTRADAIRVTVEGDVPAGVFGPMTPSADGPMGSTGATAGPPVR